MTQTVAQSLTDQEALSAARQAAADALFQGYDFNAVVSASLGWEHQSPGTEMTQVVYLEPEPDEGDDIDPEHEDDSPTVKAWFAVRFESVDSAVVKEAYAINSSGNIFGRPL